MKFQISTVRMPAATWHLVPDNPGQRDTERRARRAKHLMQPKASHLVVAMAVTPEGQQYKVDGHTRAYLWASGAVAEPEEHLHVTVYHVGCKADAVDLYDTYDSKAAVETPSDRLFGAMRYADFEPSSNMVRQGRFTSGLQLADSIAGGHKWVQHEHSRVLVPRWLPEVKLLDSLGAYGGRQFSGGLIAAFFLTARKRGAMALPFWTSYLHGEGKKDGRKMDGVQALTEYVLARDTKKTGTSGAMNLCEKAVSAFEAQRTGYVYQQGWIKSTDLYKYL